jgi:hypothetical protein
MTGLSSASWQPENKAKQPQSSSVKREGVEEMWFMSENYDEEGLVGDLGGTGSTPWVPQG